MGTSRLLVRFEDGEIWYGWYQNTADVVFGMIYPAPPDPSTICKYPELPECSHPADPATAFVDYGAGHSWPVTACRKCRAVTANAVPYEHCFKEMVEGEPQWVRELYKEAADE